MATWQCTACDFEDNATASPVCEACDEARPAAAAAHPLICIARVKDVAPIPQKDKLRRVTLDAGAAAGEVTVVTSATVYANTLVCVALPGAAVTVEGEEVVVKKATVGGVASSGMLCDSPMVGWKGGSVGLAATVPEASGLKPGDAVPAARPRGDA